MLGNVVSGGTGTNAAGVSDYEWGKTGTTDNNGDAWFCGATESATACVWVGHADSVIPMETEYGGAPVDGGTIPALIWHDVMSAWEQIRATHLEESQKGKSKDSDSTYAPPGSADTPTYSAPAPSSGGGSSSGGSTGGGGGGGGGGGATGDAAPAPQQSAPAPTPAPSGGGSSAGGVSPG